MLSLLCLRQGHLSQLLGTMVALRNVFSKGIKDLLKEDMIPEKKELPL